MKCVLPCVMLLLSVCLLPSSHAQSNPRNLNRLVGQQPLLFGRRGMNPNMNSLFFGKRAPNINNLDVKTMCNAVLSACAAWQAQRPEK